MEGKSPDIFFLVNKEFPVKNESISFAASRPSEIAQTISDCPLRQSPAIKIFGFWVP